MRSALVVAQRELFSFFVSPTAYVLLTVWLFIQGLELYAYATFFAQSAWQGGGDVTVTPLTLFFGGTSLFYQTLLVIVPLLTMRLVAAERNSGTLEPALTVPVTETAYVLGKYLAGLGMWTVLWLPTLLHVWILTDFGSVDWGVVASCYLGVFGIGTYYVALGLLASAVARTQIVAGMLTFMLIGGLFVLGILPFVLQGAERSFFEYLSIWQHMDDFSKGIVDSRHLVFDFSVAALGVFLAIRLLEARRFE